MFGTRTREKPSSLRVASAGVAAMAGHSCPATVVTLMTELGFDVSTHRAQQFTFDLASQFDLVLVMEASQRRFIDKSWPAMKGRVRRLGEWRDEEILDPYRMPEETYRHCVARIGACLDDWEGRLLS
jgi:protein-tyrosine phosphatase